MTGQGKVTEGQKVNLWTIKDVYGLPDEDFIAIMDGEIEVCILPRCSRDYATLITITVNACFAVAPQDPLAVAEAIEEAFGLLRCFSTPAAKGMHWQAGMNARALLSRLDSKTEGK